MSILRPELRENKQIEHFRDPKKNGNALAVPPGPAAGLEADLPSGSAAPPDLKRLAGTFGSPAGFAMTETHGR